MSRFSRPLFHALALCAGLVSATLARAQLPQIRVSSIFPLGGAQGSTNGVTLAGQDLDGLRSLTFSHPGIQAAPRFEAGAKDPVPNQFQVRINLDVPPGVYELRAVGSFGISNPRAFHVGRLTDITRSATNHAIANAQAVSLGSVVNGRCDANNADFFTFQAAKGRSFAIVPHTRALDSKLESVLVLYDAQRREVQRSWAGGPLEFVAFSDAAFFVEIHDATYRGGEEFGYRLEFLDQPFVASVFPPSVVPGARAELTLLGRNLPGSQASPLTRPGRPGMEEVKAAVEVPAVGQTHSPWVSEQATSVADATLNGASLWLTTSNGVSNPFRVALASSPVIPEVADNDTAGKAQKLAAPCEWVGRFHPAGDVDWAWFEVKKGEVFWIEVWCQRLGQRADPTLVVQQVTLNTKGEEQVKETQESNDQDANPGGREFRSSSLDPALRVEAREDGRIKLQLRDGFSVHRSDPNLVYRVTITREDRDFSLVATSAAPPSTKADSREAFLWSTSLRRGGVSVMNVVALRRQGFDREIDVTVEGLPEGVTAHPLRVEGDKSQGLLVLSASTDAKTWAGPVRVVGRSRQGTKELLRAAVGASVIWPVADWNLEPVVSRVSQDIALAVIEDETAPVAVRQASAAPVEAVEGGKVSVPLLVSRQPDWAGVLKLKAFGLAAMDGLKELEVDGKATNATLQLDLSQQKLGVGLHRFFLQGSTQGKYRNHPENAKLAEERVKTLDKAVEEAVKAAKGLRETAGKTAKEPKEAFEAAEKAAREAEAKQKAAEADREQARKLAKEAADKAQPKDVTVMVYSEPITVKVTAAPVRK